MTVLGRYVLIFWGMIHEESWIQPSWLFWMCQPKN